MMRKGLSSKKGFTLIELLLVLTIIGLALALIVPRAMRAQTDSKYSQVRQYGSEIASNIIVWAQSQAKAQRPETSFTLKDFLMEDITAADGAGLTSAKLVGKYTGNPDYLAVASLSPQEAPPQNPFNATSYYSKANDDTVVPSHKAGLLYLASRPDPVQSEYLNCYMLFTASAPGPDGNYWYGNMDDQDDDKIRRGIFVARLYDDREYGGAQDIFLGQPRNENIPGPEAKPNGE